MEVARMTVPEVRKHVGGCKCEFGFFTSQSLSHGILSIRILSLEPYHGAIWLTLLAFTTNSIKDGGSTADFC